LIKNQTRREIPKGSQQN